MKTRDLIAQLQAEDPTGDLECVVGRDDVYYVTRQPMYYDGRPWLLVHDEALRGKAYSVVGLRYPSDGQKVRIVTLDAESVLYEAPDAHIECHEAHRAHAEKLRAEVKAQLAAWDQEELSRAQLDPQPLRPLAKETR